MKKICLGILLFCMYGCGSAPEVVQTNGTFSESQITENRYRIGFNGNANASSDEVKDMALLRAAEVTLRNDYDWFRVVNQETEQNTTATTQGTTAVDTPRQVTRECGPLGCTTTVTPGYTGVDVVTVREVDHYNTSIEIVMGDGRLADPTSAYNASELRRSLSLKY